ncbi:hypothetical protein SASPL_111066 [Salvia splendens]|uniref:Cotton fiber protein n=1 Tax=Salvia splendens TaxID=180675 RepID=A0A8X8YA23_SALSN|nr:uncharacterized protein LOC121799485 [Salvia splendens]KAG6426832.1 hypothetical protein SASPL_111066 [Salvia splendens]
MSRKNSMRSRRAWDVLRLALLWARRGGAFRNRMAINMRLLQKGIRKLRHSHHHGTPLVYGERELSFDDTPVIHVKMHRPASLRFMIPCIKPQVDFDYDFDFDDDEIYAEEEEEKVIGIGEECDEEVDLKAEEFIANFYKQMKLQRQISYLQYHEKRSTN